VGPQIAPHCRCDGLRGEVVHAVVRDSAWMQHIQMKKREILVELNEALGEPLIRDLRLRVGSVED
jgi:predicted nucleic acid-binding Zn ribbon protein